MATSTPIVIGNGISYAIGDLSTNLAGTFIYDSGDLSLNAKEDAIIGNTGNTATVILSDYNCELTFESVPYGATGSTTIALAPPTLGQKVTVTGTQHAEFAGTAWYVMPPYSVKISKDGYKKVSCKLKQWQAIT